MCWLFQTSLVAIEDKLSQADSEMAQLRASLRQYETLLDEYRVQVRSRLRHSTVFGAALKTKF